MPNDALASLAGNIDPHHRVAIADLILVQRRVRETVERLVREFTPDVVGLSVRAHLPREHDQVPDSDGKTNEKLSNAWCASRVGDLLQPHRLVKIVY